MPHITDRVHVHADHGSIAAGHDLTIERIEHISAQQVHALGILPCPRCELRLVGAGMRCCRHCAAALASARTRDRLNLWLGAWLLCYVLALRVATALAVPGLPALVFAGVVAAGLLWALRRAAEWLHCAGEHTHDLS